MTVVVETPAFAAKPVLMKTQRPADKPPQYDIKIFEEVDKNRGEIIKKATWTEKGKYFDNRLGWVTTSTKKFQLLGRRPINSLPDVEAETEEANERDIAPDPRIAPEPPPYSPPSRPIAPPPPVVQEGRREKNREGFQLPKKVARHERIPEIFPDNLEAPAPKPKAKIEVPVAPPLTKSVVAALQTLDWDFRPGQWSQEERDDLVKSVERAQEAIGDWQSNLHGRFALCPIDKVEAKTNGTLETLYIPYEVVSGRVWLAKHGAHRVRYLVTTEFEEGNWTLAFMLLIRRLESLDRMLARVAKEGASDQLPYLNSLRDAMKSLDPYVKRLGSRHSDDERIWATRWQLIALELVVIKERGEIIADALTPKERARWSELRSQFEDLNREIGSTPWKDSLSKQWKFSERLYKVANEASELYVSLADYVDSGEAKRHHLDFLAVMGSLEDLRLFSLTQAEDLAPSRADGDRN